MLNFSINNFVLWQTSKCRGKSRRGEGHIVVYNVRKKQGRSVMSLATYTSTTFLWTPYHFIAPLPLSNCSLQKVTTSNPQSHLSTSSSLISCSLPEETEMGRTSLSLEIPTAGSCPQQPSLQRSGFPRLGATAVDPPHASTSAPVFPVLLDL